MQHCSFVMISAIPMDQKRDRPSEAVGSIHEEDLRGKAAMASHEERQARTVLDQDQLIQAQEEVIAALTRGIDLRAQILQAQGREITGSRNGACLEHGDKASLVNDRHVIEGDIRSSNSSSKTGSEKPSRRSSAESSQTWCSRDVYECEHVWEIAGISWLKGVLFQGKNEDVVGKIFCCGDAKFRFRYHPRGLGNGTGWQFSLALERMLSSTNASVVFRWKILIQRSDGEFIEWGAGFEMGPEETYTFFGPDVVEGAHGGVARGIFGLRYKELLESEWVQQDALTVKCMLEVLWREWFFIDLWPCTGS